MILSQFRYDPAPRKTLFDELKALPRISDSVHLPRAE